MLRHRLASFFEPKSLLVITNTALPILNAVPPALQRTTTLLKVEDLQQLDKMLNETSLPDDIDLVVLCVFPSWLPKIFDYLSHSPPKALLMLSPNKVDVDPKENRSLVRAWVKENNCMLIGIRSFGLQRPHLKLNLSRSMSASPGKLAVVSQSRMLAKSVVDWSLGINVGLSTIVSSGEIGGVSIPELLEYFAGDVRTDGIVLYLDRLSSGRELMSAIRTAASMKPVIVLRAGRTDSRLAGNDQVFDAALRRSGAVRVHYFVDLFSTLKVLTHKRRPKGGKVAIVANGRAQAQLMVDEMLSKSQSMKLAIFSPDTMDKLDALLGRSSMIENPVVIYDPINGEHIIEILKILQEDTNIDAIMPIFAPDDSADLDDVMQKFIDFMPYIRKPILNTMLGEHIMSNLRRVLDRAGSPTFRTPETAISGMRALVSYHYNQQLLQQIRIPFFDTEAPDKQAGLKLINSLRAENRRELTADQAHQMLSFYRADICWGGNEKDEHYSVADDIPAVRILVKRDPVFGPWIYFGEGGHEVNISTDDRGLDLPPLNAYLAAQLIERSRLYKQELKGYISPSIFKKLQQLLEVVSELVTDFPGIEDMQINPIIIGYQHLNVRHASMTLTENYMPDMPEEGGYAHMAIYPYPNHLVEHLVFKEGKAWTIRPIRPEDIEQLQSFIRGLSDESRYMRFVSMMRELTPKMLARYTYVDYHRELALVATTTVPDPDNPEGDKEIIIGLAHYLRNADGVGAEYALVVSDEWQGNGLGRKLMTKLLDEAKAQGLVYIEGVILAKNRPMLNLMTSLGMINESDPEDPTMRRLWKPFK